MAALNRRELFNLFVPSSTPEVASPETVVSENIMPDAPTWSRRSFLKFILAAGAATSLSDLNIETADAQEPVSDEGAEEDATESVTSIKLDEKTEEAKNPYTQTLLEQGLVMVAKSIAESTFEKLGIEHGNKSLTDERLVEMLRDKPIEGLLEGGILGPVLEEAIFRALPSSLINNMSRRSRWGIGISSTVLFALAHNREPDESGNIQFAKSIPISQFMGGLFYWYLMRERGYTQAVLAHSANNTVALSIGILLFKSYPDEKALQVSEKLFGIKDAGGLSKAKATSSLETPMTS